MKKFFLFPFIIFWFATIFSAPKDKPTFLLVHGAWHGAWAWFELEYQLQKDGYNVISIDLPAHGIDTVSPRNVTLNSYVNAITQVLDTISSEIILVGHSMGGIAITAAAEQRPDKISKLVYLAAFLPQNGQSMFQLASSDLQSKVLPNIIVDTINLKVDLKQNGVREIFYSESTLNYVILSEKLLRPEPLIPLLTPVTITAAKFGSIRRFYIETTYDMAITPFLQNKMYTATPCEEVYTLHTEHSPFFSAPENLKNILSKIDKTAKPPKSPKSVAVADSKAVQVTMRGSNRVSVDFDKPINSPCKLNVYNSNGQLVLTRQYKSNNSVVDLSSLATGIYIIKVFGKEMNGTKEITIVH